MPVLFFLLCIVLALLLINDILYNDVPVLAGDFLCTRGARGCSVENCVLLLDDCHSSSKEICWKRGANDEKVECDCDDDPFFPALVLCYVDLE